MKSYTVYLFRHGLTKGNLNAQYIGQTDLPLTMDSINQLHTLRGKYPYPEVDAVFTSPLKRCKDSAAILFPRNNLITIEDFKEYNFGEFEGKTAAELQDNLDFRDWLQGDMQASPPYGETNAQFMHRVCAAFEKVSAGCVQTGTRRIALVCHAGVMMTLLTCYGLPEAAMANWQTDPGFGYKLHLDPALWMRANKMQVEDTAPIPMAQLEQVED